MPARWICGLFALLCAASISSAGDRPNVLYIVSDDLNCDLGCYGSEKAATPEIDRLAESGLTFTKAYCQYPVCNPSRNSFLSGMRPDEIGLPKKWTALRELVPDVTTLPQLFRENGYFTASVSKIFHISQWDPVKPTSGWRLGDEKSWDIRLNTQPQPTGNGRPPFPREGRRITLPSNRKGAGSGGTIDFAMESSQSKEAQEDGQAVIEATKILDDRPDKPFFLAVGFRRPHAPFVATSAAFKPHQLGEISLPELGSRDDVPPFAFTVFPPNYDQPERCREFRQAYFACVTFLDEVVGDLLDAIDERGLTEETIVVFFSDHGFHLGEHGQWHKFTLFEESARVPLILRVPGRTEPGSRCDRVVELVDLYPTLQELCGLPEPNQKLAGRSLVLLIKKPGRERDNVAITQVRRGSRSGRPPVMGYSIRTDRYRLTEWWSEEDIPRQMGAELYDHQTDPAEETNLLAHSGSSAAPPEVATDLSRRLAEYRINQRAAN
ncbi:sulfatase [Stratiformator vulcanicus]|uniref:Choline-sulfatase n=1 Tax=Stratiformator vulcanicus TaxID=2527980 RepID=A0A517R6H8_9PLAN|nr:sulfatase [Stratiformator vulcanicus]QDT39489.1 Choline-sulfatase [Stratiformator vulcanicus]